jgi:predicted nucleotidyltransferase
MSIRIEIDRDRIADLCRRWHVAQLALFGSVLRADFRDDSDVDVLVAFKPEARIGLLALARMERELSELLRRRVDLVTRGGLKPRLREAILAEAEILYAP